jgi:DNA-binding NarL/FixJ family response regulator
LKTSDTVLIASRAGCVARVLSDKVKQSDLKMVGVAESSKDLTAKLKGMARPDYLFIEDNFCGRLTEGFIKKLKRKYRRVTVVVWTLNEISDTQAARLMAAGAESFFSMRKADKELDFIVSHLASGKCYIPHGVKEIIDDENFLPDIGKVLSDKEKEVIKLVTVHDDNKWIAETMKISIDGVKKHRKSIYAKCGESTSVELLKFGILHRVICFDDLHHRSAGEHDVNTI